MINLIQSRVHLGSSQAFQKSQKQDTFLMTGGTNKSKSKVLDLNQQYRSDQIRQLLMQEDSSSQSQRVQNSNLPIQAHHQKNASSIQFDGNFQNESIKSINLSSLEKTLTKYTKAIDEVKEDKTKLKLKQMKDKFEEELKKISMHYEEIERIRLYLNNKIETVEQMELENLETHIILEHRLRNTDEHKKLLLKTSTQEVQTDMNYKQVIDKEKQIEIKENELEIQKFKGRQDTDQRERVLLRRERDLEIRERLNEEKRVEYTFKQKELNQRLKAAMTYPLNCLQNDQKLGVKLKDMKLTPDIYKGLNLESDQSFAEFMNRDDNKKFLKALQGEPHLRAEGLLKCEYVILQERSKMEIVKEYMESEIAQLDSEKNELIKEREKYSNLIEMERQIQDEKKSLESQRVEYQSLIDNLKKNLVIIPNELTFYGTLKSQHESTGGVQLSKIEGVNQSVFDSALQKTNSLMTNLLSPSKLIKPIAMEQINESTQENHPISSKIEKILQNFDRLNEQYVSQQKIDLIEKKENNIEAIKKLLIREAYFIEEEKRLLNDKRQQLVLKGAFSQASKSNLEKAQIRSSQGLSHNKSFDREDYEGLQEERKQLIVMQENLKMEKELQQKLTKQLEDQISYNQKENEKLVDLEKRMNEQKLKMLLKFEKIKQIEDFYNKYHPDSTICLEIEITDEEMNRAALKLQQKYKNRFKSEQEIKELKLNTLNQILKGFLHKKLLSDPSNENILAQYFMMYWKSQILIKRIENEKARQILRSLDKESIQRLGLRPQYKNEFTEEPLQDWFEAFWAKKSKELNLESFKKMNADQLYLIGCKFQNDIEQFWKFKCAQVLKMVNLHLKRRARLLLAFAFQTYKYQAQKSKVAFILQIKENAFKNSNIFRQAFRNNSDYDDSQQLSENIKYSEVVGGGGAGTDTEDEQFIVTTPKMASDNNQLQPIDNKKIRITMKNHRFDDTAVNNKRMDTLESQNSHIYTGISDIIMQQNQVNLKRHSIMVYLLHKKDSQETIRMKSLGLNRWKSFIRDLEMWSIKGEIKRLINEVEGLKFQEQMLRTSFRVQKNELESKVSELITYVLGGNNQQQSTGSLIL